MTSSSSSSLSAAASALAAALRGGGSLVVLTGAGISASSGIPTFRGPEGFWRVGSRNHRPQEMATRAMFARSPWEVWGWYLHRLGLCRAAVPNAAHLAVVELGELASPGFTLVTQNVDGLHGRAGSPPERLFEIHGSLELMRCAGACRRPPWPVPSGLAAMGRDEVPGDEVRRHLVCPDCGGPARPHVLWFDETYDEEHYRFESSLAAAGAAEALVVVGTSGATNLPLQMGALAARRGVVLVDVNPEDGPFGAFARRTARGFPLREAADVALPRLVAGLRSALAR